MAAKVVNRGLQVTLDRAFGIGGPPAAIQTMSVDDSTVAFTATDTALNSGGAVTNAFDKATDTPTRSGQTVTVSATFATSEANFTIRRIALHNAAAASVDTTTATLVGGVDAQAVTKTSDFTLKITLNWTAADAS